jgi:hypothetical protein
MPNDQAIGCVYTYLCQVKHVNGLKVVILHFNHGGGFWLVVYLIHSVLSMNWNLNCQPDFLNQKEFFMHYTFDEPSSQNNDFLMISIVKWKFKLKR